MSFRRIPSRPMTPMPPAPEAPRPVCPIDPPELLDDAIEGIVLTDAEGAVRWCNRTMCERFLQKDKEGDWMRRPANCVMKSLFIEPDDWARVSAAMARLPRMVERRAALENLSLGWGGAARMRVDLRLALVEGQTNWTVWYFHDATALREAQDNLARLMKHSSDGIFLFDSEYRLLLFNEACERITGFKAREVLHRERACHAIFRRATGDTAGDVNEALFPPDLWGKNDFPRPIHEVEMHTKSGEVKWVEINFTPIPDASQGRSLMLGIVRDVTERRRLEEKLHLTRKLATLGELTSALAHEIKNPLGIIMAAAQILTKPDRGEDEKAEAAQYIVEETRRLDDRLKSFLQFSRPRQPVLNVQNIHRVIDKTLIAYQTLDREGLEFETDFAADPAKTAIDADQIQQVLLNLLLNADQAMQGQGTVTIRTSLNAHFVRIDVIDEGPGIPGKQVQRLFEPFFSTKPQGTGLGLATAMQIVTAHGGKLEARNCPGGGAAFMIHLPSSEQ